MKLLLDAHALLWFIWGHANLSPKAKSLMMDPSNELFLSAATIWEIAVKVGLGKLTLAEPYADFMERAIAANNLAILDINVRHGAILSSLPFIHRDPFDRMSIAQAMCEAIPLLSCDESFDAYSITRMW